MRDKTPSEILKPAHTRGHFFIRPSRVDDGPKKEAAVIAAALNHTRPEIAGRAQLLHAVTNAQSGILSDVLALKSCALMMV